VDEKEIKSIIFPCLNFPKQLEIVVFILRRMQHKYSTNRCGIIPIDVTTKRSYWVDW